MPDVIPFSGCSWHETSRPKLEFEPGRYAGEKSMLELRPSCECCDVDLPPDSNRALICSFECTFCKSCAESRLGGICPNCGGGLVVRPIRPAAKLEAYPASTLRIYKPVSG